jgi:hypothetical protein
MFFAHEDNMLEQVRMIILNKAIVVVSKLFHIFSLHAQDIAWQSAPFEFCSSSDEIVPAGNPAYQVWVVLSPDGAQVRMNEDSPPVNLAAGTMLVVECVTESTRKIRIESSLCLRFALRLDGISPRWREQRDIRKFWISAAKSQNRNQRRNRTRTRDARSKPQPMRVQILDQIGIKKFQ